MSAIVTVFTVFGSEADATRISRQLVEERLAACANILAPCHSIYRWQGKVEEAQEHPVLLKTKADTAAALLARIAALHDYELPAAVVWPIETALSAYAEWVAAQSGD